MSSPHVVLFDLDGTLLDTAPDLAWALNEVRRAHGHDPLPYESIRPHVSNGSFALTRLGCRAPETSAEFEDFRLALLDTYAANVAQHTEYFAGMESLLCALEADQRIWGIVTNKPEWLTNPLLESLDITNRSAVVISGDTAAAAKPDPAPLLLAAERLGASAENCVYVGDAQRDITAGRAAGMHTLVAMYGYIGKDDAPESWGADQLIYSPADVLAWLAAFGEP